MLSVVVMLAVGWYVLRVVCRVLCVVMVCFVRCVFFSFFFLGCRLLNVFPLSSVVSCLL